MKLTAHQLENLSLDSVSDLPWQKISCDWFGAPCPQVFFSLAISAQHILFNAKVVKPAIFASKNKLGDFAPELWKLDCAELFLAENNSSHYQEINLAPHGAWWSANFTAARTLAAQQKTLAVLTTSEITETYWQASILVPVEQLAVKPERANITFVLAPSKEASETNCQYLSFTKLSKTEPDFHLPAEFPEIIFTDNKC